jgi:hypothetical protein
MAIACFRLFTLRPDPLFSDPRFLRRIADSTFFDADRPYFAITCLRRRSCKLCAEATSTVGGRHSCTDFLAPTSETVETAGGAMAERKPTSGISNRESPDEEARERQEHPAADTGSPPPEDAAGRVGEQPLTDNRDRHTSHKAGSRSIAQKEAESKYPDRSMPASRKVPGAFGREPDENENKEST